MARFIAAAFLFSGIFSTGCAAYLANQCIGRSPRGCGGSDALITASLLAIEHAEPLPPSENAPPDAPGTRPPGK